MTSIAFHFCRCRFLTLRRLLRSSRKLSSLPMERCGNSQLLTSRLNKSNKSCVINLSDMLSHQIRHYANFNHHKTCASSVDNKEDTDVDLLLPLHFSYITTSAERWHDYPDGVQFDCGFVDSMPGHEFSSRVPVVVGLPSCVGNHRELSKLLMIFVKLGYRVLIPNMPGSYLCRGRSRSDATIFSFTIDEKAEFVKDFLAEFQIEKVDLLVTNSCSVYTGLELCLHNSNLFKSLAMINPTGLDLTRAMKPLLFHQNLAYVWDELYHMQPLIGVFVFLGKMFTKKRNWPVSDIVAFSRTMDVISFEDVRENAHDINAREIPRLAIYTDNTQDLDRASTEKLLDSMGIPKSSITIFDQNDKIIVNGEPNNNNYGVFFEGDVRDIKTEKSAIIKKKLWDFFKKVRSDL